MPISVVLRKRIQVIFFLAFSFRAWAGTIDIGSRLVQARDSYETAIHLGYTGSADFKGIHSSYRFETPVFMPFTSSAPFIPGIRLFVPTFDSGATPTSALADKEYLVSIVQEFQVDTGKLSAGVRHHRFKPIASENIIWGNLYYDRTFPWLIPHGFVEFEKGAVHTSSINHPSFTEAHYEFRPFEGHGTYLLNELTIMPVAWVDFLYQASPQHYGGGLDIRTGGIRKSAWAFGFLASAAVINRPDSGILHQEQIGAWLELWDVSLASAFIVKSENHPTGVYLSPLLVTRREITFSGSSSITPGMFFEIGPRAGAKNGFKARIYFYSGTQATASLYLYYFHETKIFKIETGWLREDIYELGHFSHNTNPHSFLNFDLSIDIVPEKLSFKWQTYLNWYQAGHIRSNIMALFRF